MSVSISVTPALCFKVLALPPVEGPTLLADMVVAVLRTCTFLAEVAAALPAALAEVMVVFIVGLVSLASCRVAFSSPPALVLFFVVDRLPLEDLPQLAM